MEPKRVYFIQETVRDKDGGFIPCIAEENSPGYWKTDWNWGSDRETAQKFCDQKNANLGFTPEEAYLIQLSSMRPLR